MSDADSDVNEFRMEEQLFDTESDQQSSEKVIQKLNETKSLIASIKILKIKSID